MPCFLFSPTPPPILSFSLSDLGFLVNRVWPVLLRLLTVIDTLGFMFTKYPDFFPIEKHITCSWGPESPIALQKQITSHRTFYLQALEISVAEFLAEVEEFGSFFFFFFF
ncbi:hypothetical protein H1C71_017747, partial [Ictidomys tridecemlineatus]